MKAAVILKKIQVRATAKWQTFLWTIREKHLCLVYSTVHSSKLTRYGYVLQYRFKVIHMADNVLAPGAWVLAYRVEVTVLGGLLY